LFNIIFENT